jgi:hypothetical protein
MMGLAGIQPCMSLPIEKHSPTDSWRKYPKGPNFFGIVVGASVVLVLLLIAAWFVLRADGRKMIPHGPNPEPNSLVQPLLPTASQRLSV